MLTCGGAILAVPWKQTIERCRELGETVLGGVREDAERSQDGTVQRLGATTPVAVVHEERVRHHFHGQGDGFALTVIDPALS